MTQELISTSRIRLARARKWGNKDLENQALAELKALGVNEHGKPLPPPVEALAVESPVTEAPTKPEKASEPVSRPKVRPKRKTRSSRR